MWRVFLDLKILHLQDPSIVFYLHFYTHTHMHTYVHKHLILHIHCLRSKSFKEINHKKTDLTICIHKYVLTAMILAISMRNYIIKTKLTHHNIHYGVSNRRFLLTHSVMCYFANTKYAFLLEHPFWESRCQLLVTRLCIPDN